MGSSSTSARVAPKKQRKKASGAGAGGTAAALLPRRMSRRRGRRTWPPPTSPPAKPYPLFGSTSRRAAVTASNAAAAAAASAASNASIAAAKLAEEETAAEETSTALKAQQEAAAALKAQQAAAHPFSESASWPCLLEVEKVVGKIGTVKQIEAATHQLYKLRNSAVDHVVNPVLQTAYERKKEELAARLGGAANVNERFVFHGTSMASSEAIINNNFCLSKVRNTRCRFVCSDVSSFINLTHRARIRLDETLAASWEPARARAILEEASTSPTV
jgi:hypothetical protein